jgi:hypothetical protein
MSRENKNPAIAMSRNPKVSGVPLAMLVTAHPTARSEARTISVFATENRSQRVKVPVTMMARVEMKLVAPTKASKPAILE